MNKYAEKNKEKIQFYKHKGILKFHQSNLSYGYIHLWQAEHAVQRLLVRCPAVMTAVTALEKHTLSLGPLLNKHNKIMYSSNILCIQKLAFMFYCNIVKGELYPENNMA